MRKDCPFSQTGYLRLPMDRLHTPGAEGVPKLAGPPGQSRWHREQAQLMALVHLAPGPDFIGSQWLLSPSLPRFAARADCGCSYHIRVQLASADYIVLASFEPPPVTIHQWNDATWTEVRPHLLPCPSQHQDGSKRTGPGWRRGRPTSCRPQLPRSLPLPRSPTPSQTTLQASATSYSSTGARTPSSGPAGTGPVSPTAASSSAPRPAGAWLLPGRCLRRRRGRLPSGLPTSSPWARGQSVAICSHPSIFCPGRREGPSRQELSL